MPTLHSVIDSVMKRVRRSPFYFERYNNTCDFATNRNYTKYAAECRAAYKARNSGAELPASPLWKTAATGVQRALPVEKARALSAKITQLIETNDPCVKHVQNEGRSVHIKEPLKALGADILDVLKNSDVDNALKSFFQGYYRVEWVTCFRSLPANTVAGSWLWHSDSFPPHTCKMFIHLTDTTAETGATEFMNLEDTMAYRRAGYFGQFQDERFADLQDFAKHHNLQYRPYHFDAAAGDATVFDMNFFHRAVSPRSAYRDVVCLLLFPNPVPWNEQIQKDGLATLMNKSAGKLPKDPHPNAVTSAAASTMM